MKLRWVRVDKERRIDHWPFNWLVKTEVVTDRTYHLEIFDPDEGWTRVPVEPTKPA